MLSCQERGVRCQTYYFLTLGFCPLASKTTSPRKRNITMQDIYAYIDDYVSGTLKGSQLQEFEARLRSDSDFAAEIATYQQMQNTVSKKDLDFMELLDEVDAEHRSTTTTLDAEVDKKSVAATPDLPKKTSRFRLLALAASVLLLLGIGWWLTQSANQTIQKNTLTLFQPVAKEESKGEEKDDKFNLRMHEGSNLFKARKYEAAIISFQDAGKYAGDIGRNDARWYTALSYMMLENTKTATTILEQIKKDKYAQNDQKEDVEKALEVIRKHK